MQKNKKKVLRFCGILNFFFFAMCFCCLFVCFFFCLKTINKNIRLVTNDYEDVSPQCPEIVRSGFAELIEMGMQTISYACMLLRNRSSRVSVFKKNNEKKINKNKTKQERAINTMRFKVYFDCVHPLQITTIWNIFSCGHEMVMLKQAICICICVFMFIFLTVLQKTEHNEKKN